MPKPAAAFSPFTMTKSSPSSRRSRGTCSTTTSRPERPTISPQKRRRMGLADPHGFALGHDPIERLIAIIARYRRRFQSREGHADGERFASVAQLGDRAVVEAAAIAKAIAGPVI